MNDLTPGQGWRLERSSGPRLGWVSLAVLIVVGMAGCAVLLRAIYLGPAFEAAQRIEAANSPLVDEVEYVGPNVVDGHWSLRIDLKHDTTQAQVDAFWCNVVLPAGGTEQMYRDQSLTLHRSNQQAGEIGNFYPSLRCTNATPMARPSPRIAPSAPIECDVSQAADAPRDCPAEIAEVGTLLAEKDLVIASMVIRPYGSPCLHPFKRDPEGCVLDRDRATAWVTFVGSADVAIVTIESRPSGPWVSLAFLSVPQAGWQVPPLDMQSRPRSS